MDQNRGLLDLDVALSTPDIMAGQEFSIFVLVKNPFDRPVWIERVHVSVPSEIGLAQWERAKQAAEVEQARQKQLAQEEQVHRNAAIREEAQRRAEMKDLDNQIANIEKQIREKPDDPGTPQLKEKLKALQIRHAELALRSEGFYAEGVSIVVTHGGKLSYPTFETTGKASVTVHGEDTEVSYLKVIDPTRFLVQAQVEATRTVDLQGSLPESAALQPGNTAVYTVIMNTKNPLLFRPSQYRLQFSVNYSFEKKSKDSDDRGNLYTNTMAMTLSIRASIYSVIIGAAGGGLFGSLARLLQSPAFTIQTLPESLISLVLSLLLSVVAIIFLARKSGVQSFVSVEDFWGGLLIGFLVGYSGASFFQELTGMSALPGA